MNNRRFVSLVTGLAVLTGSPLVYAAEPTSADISSPAVEYDGTVFHWQRTVQPDGRVLDDTLNTELLERLESPGYWIDLQTLQDSEGRSYRLEADAWQQEGDESIHYDMKVVRIRPRKATRRELAQAWAKTQAHEDLDAFLARKRTNRVMPSRVDESLMQRLHTASDNEWIDVVVVLHDQPTRKIPRLAPGLFQDEPALALAQLEARTIAIEERKNEVEAAQRSLVNDLRRSGGRLLSRYWLSNGFEARLRAQDIDRLIDNPAVRKLELKVEATADTNNLDDMREATQIVQLHDAGFDGETASGASTINDIHIGIIDDNVDADHPAWNDVSSGSSRLVDIWREVSGVWTTVSTSATSTSSHGTKVTGIVLGDLMQGQDPAITSTADRDDRTGFAPEASFSFFEKSAGTTDAIEKAVEESVDIINLSISSSYSCDLGHSTNAAADEAALAGIFVAKSSGSNGSTTATCNIGNPGTASGAFSVAAYDRSATPLVTGLVPGPATGHGPDAFGRAVVSLVAPAGTEGATTPASDDTYGVFGATSSSTPVIAGSAAVLKNHLASVFSSSIANNTGFLYAAMMVMTDGENDGGYVGAQVPMDPEYGAGRFRARMLNAEGMDSPWRFRMISRTLDDGEIASDLFLNPDASGVNQPLPSDVERARAAIYWHEPNLEFSSSDTASISATICGDNGFCYGSGNAHEERQRLLLGNVAGGVTWEIRLNAYDVPASLDTGHLYGLDRRVVHVAVYWEDTDRDDSNGPGADIQ